MTTFADMLYHLGGVPVGAFDPVMLAGGKWYFCDPTHGTADADATTPETANSSLLKCYNKTRDGYNDGVIFMGGATAWNPSAMLTWSNTYTHLIGTSTLPGLGNRCRIVALAADDLTVPVTFSGAGCVIKNIQINNEHAGTAATGCAIVTAQRSVFENVFFMAPTSNYAASYSLKDSGAENAYIRCTIGQYTNFRAGASYGLWLHKGAGSSVCRNKYIKCEFLSWGGGGSGDHVAVLIDVDIIAVPWTVQFEDCLFANNYGGGTILAEAINDNNAVTSHQVILRGKNSFVGFTAAGGTLTYLFTQTKGSGGLMAASAENGNY
jgi:hypothetical protein